MKLNQQLIADIQGIIAQARAQAVHSVDTQRVLSNDVESVLQVTRAEKMPIEVCRAMR